MTRFTAPSAHLKICSDCAAAMGGRQAGIATFEMIRDAVGDEAKRVSPTLYYLIQHRAEAFDLVLSPRWTAAAASAAAYEYTAARIRGAFTRGESLLETGDFLRFAEHRMVPVLSQLVVEYAICVNDRRILGRVPALIQGARRVLEAQGIHPAGKLVGVTVCNILRGSFDAIVDAFDQAVEQFDPERNDVPPFLGLAVLQELDRAIANPALSPEDSRLTHPRALAELPQWLNPVVFNEGVVPMARAGIIMTGRSFITLEAIERVRAVFSTAHSRHLAIARVVLQLSYDEVAASSARLEKHQAGAEVARKELSQAMRRIGPTLEGLGRLNPHVCQYALQRDLFEYAFEPGIPR